MPGGKKCNCSGLEKTGWNRKAAARLLGVSYRTILYKIDQYEMTAPESYSVVLAGEIDILKSQGNRKVAEVEPIPSARSVEKSR